MTTLILIAVLLAVIIIGLLLLGKIKVIEMGLSQRQEFENQMAGSIKKVENVLTGSFSKGSAGENIVESALATLPPEWLVRNFGVGNKTVEFGVRLPDTLVLPIDSKVVLTDLLEQFTSCQDADQRRKLKSMIQVQTRNRAVEIQKYLDPSVTTSFGLAVVSDALFAICSEIVPTLFQQNVMLMSYSMLIPYILLLFHMTLKNTQTIDLQRLDAFVNGASQNVAGLRHLIHQRFSRPMTMLNGFKADVEVQLNKLSANLAALRGLDIAPDAANEQPEEKFPNC